MDASRFDAVTKVLVEPSSRRRALQLLAGSGLGVMLATLGSDQAEAEHFGCRHIKKACKRGKQCCSGVCQGKKGKKTCRAHDKGTCTRNQEDICVNIDFEAANCDQDPACSCYTTTGGARFCGNDASAFCLEPEGTECKRDSHCGDGAACAVVLESCGDCGPLGTFCVRPCGSLATANQRSGVGANAD